MGQSLTVDLNTDRLNMINSSGAIDLEAYPVPRTRVSLEIFSTGQDEAISTKSMLMCVIEGMDELGETQAGDPIKDGRLVFDYDEVHIVLQDEGSPRGRFLNDIASWTLRGLAEWMTIYDRYRELTVRVTYNQYFCGTAKVSRNAFTALANGTAVSTRPNIAASTAPAEGVATA